MKNHSDRPRKEPIYGVRPVLEALASGRQIDKVLLKKTMLGRDRQDILDEAAKAKIPVQQVPVDKLDRLVGDRNHQGVVALISMIHYVNLEDLVLSLQDRKLNPLLVMLDQISDVRNFGAISRTVECMGGHGIIIPSQGAAQVNIDAIRVSSGALHYLPVCRVNHLADAAFLLESYDIPMVSLTEKSETSLYDADLSGPVCLVAGSEDRGISKRILKLSKEQVAIPLQGKVASLNVSVATGIALAEVVRQRVSNVKGPV